MIVLYTGDRHFSSWSMRGRLMLVEKGITFEERHVELDWPLNLTPDGSRIVGDGNDLRESTSGCVCEPDDLRTRDAESALAGSLALALPRVPVLVDTTTGAVASDVLAIADQLDDTYPPPSHRRLWPANPVDRARAKSLAAHIHCDLHVLLHEASFAKSLWTTPLMRLCEIAQGCLSKVPTWLVVPYVVSWPVSRFVTAC
jgi:glutathione S-transferase